MKLLASFLFISIFFFSFAAYAQVDRGSVEQFYRPIKASDLVTKLPPRIDEDKLFGNDNLGFTSDGGGCPEQINIGSISDDADIFGNVDIEVFIGNDVFIDCGGL